MIQDSLLFCTLAPLVLGFASAYDTRRAVKSKWYRSVKKPWFNPPKKVFAPIWTYLYISTGYALYLIRNQMPILEQEGSTVLSTLATWGVYAFWSQMLANFLWSSLYFVQREINLALFDIICLSGLAVITTCCFYAVDATAGLLMLPYLAWALYATTLTYSVKELNPDFSEDPRSS